MKGFAGGVIWGVVVSAMGLVALSLMGPVPQRQTEAPVPTAPAEEAAPAAAPAETPVSPPAPAEAPMPDATPEPAEAPPAAETAPVAGAVEVPPGSEFNRPGEEGEARLPGTDAPAAQPAAPAVSAPEAGTPPVADTTPAAPPAAGTEAPGAPATPEAPAPAPDAGLPEGGAEAPVLPAPGAPAPSDPAPEAAPDAPQAPVATPDPVPAPEPAPETAPAPAPAEPAPQPPVTEAPEAPQPPESDAPQIPDETPPGALSVPAPGSAGIDRPDLRTGRLPTVGDTPAAEEAAAEPDPASLPALSRYAVPFQRDEGLPLFSVILIDEGAEGLDRAVLTTFSFPVTFAIDPTRPDAAEAMQAYRAAGFEVVLLARGLPQGAGASDVETSFGPALTRLDQTVAVMDAEVDGLGVQRPLIQQMLALLGDTGHGLLSYDRGLNTAQQMAQSAGVPAATVFRSLDGDRESAVVIRRYLDRAAFKAEQDGQVIMIGHSYPDTVTALFAWALEGGGDRVQLAPVSAILRDTAN